MPTCSVGSLVSRRPSWATMRWQTVQAPASAVGSAARGPGGRVRTTFYVDVADLQRALDRARQLGGKVASPPMTIPGTSISLAQFTDPEGKLAGLGKGWR